MCFFSSMAIVALQILSTCKSLPDIFFPRQLCGSLFHPSTSKRRLRSTCLSLQTAQKPSRTCYRHMPLLMSMSKSIFLAYGYITWDVHCEVLCAYLFLLGCCWPTPMSWLKCRRGTTPVTHEAAQLSTRDITAWTTYAFHVTFHFVYYVLTHILTILNPYFYYFVIYPCR